MTFDEYLQNENPFRTLRKAVSGILCAPAVAVTFTQESDMATVLNAPPQITEPAFEPDSDPSPFTREDVQHFRQDDIEAGRRIGKILSTLFIYTLIAMSVVVWWTLRVVAE